ncbi:MAG: hypothetical protein II794_06610, partial [Oscillospiraceae bacterium]|nr:hypothetical protein [Oscillospiraceae bacterium]
MINAKKLLSGLLRRIKRMSQKKAGPSGFLLNISAWCCQIAEIRITGTMARNMRSFFINSRQASSSHRSTRAARIMP